MVVKKRKRNFSWNQNQMTTDADEPLEDSSEITIDESTPTVSRAQSNYSTQRTKLLIAPAKYGETRAKYLWRLLRCSIRRTIDAVSRADDSGKRKDESFGWKYFQFVWKDIERSHGLHFVRNINHNISVKCVGFNSKRKVSWRKSLMNDDWAFWF